MPQLLAQGAPAPVLTAPADASASGTFRIGGEIAVNRLGFGAMRLTGEGVWGEPADRAECLRVLRRLPELGVTFIDTADSYGPDVSEHLIHEALHPYGGILVATKAGLVRSGPGGWHPVGRPEYLRQQALMSRRFLGVEQIGLWQLHRIDPKVPRDEQFAAIRSLLDDGVIRLAGLSEVSVEEIEAELRDRYGVPPEPVKNLLEVARLRTVARAASIGDVAVQGTMVRFGPVDLRESQQMRLMRLYPGTIVKEALHTILVPRPMTARVGGTPVRDEAVLRWASDLLRAILLDDIASGARAVEAANSASSTRHTERSA